MNDLEKYFRQNNNRLIHKWNHYFNIYDRHFSRFRNKEIVVLEIGVYQGGSLQMWKSYFGDKARIFGIDIDERCKDLTSENISVIIGSQSDRDFLRKVRKEVPPIDILIDDGGHTMTQQRVTFEELFDHVKDDGVYLAEDLHTSYRLNYGGGYKRRGTFIEYSKNFIDYLNAYHSEQRSLKVNDFTRCVDSIHYYDSVLVIEKMKRGEPFEEKTGIPSLEAIIIRRGPVEKALLKSREFMARSVNKVSRFFRIKEFPWLRLLP
jgi:hypothetical protein